MKIAILSDSHDNKSGLVQALQKIHDAGIRMVLFAGDLCAPSVLRDCFGKFPDITVHTVFGNNDGDRYRMAVIGAGFPNIVQHGEYAAMDIDGKRIGMTHYPFYATSMAKSGDFDLVVFGHDHLPRVESYQKCMAANPGSILGDMHAASFAVYDTQSHEAIINMVD